MPRIYDAVYGYIELDEVEFALVNSPIFQRLHWIKQLGPLNTIFPSAQHSRFSHSIGVFHIMKKMIRHFEKKEKSRYYQKVALEDWRALVFAALLHDIGHVPLSHIGEQVLARTCASSMEEDSIDVKEKHANWKDLFPEELCGGSEKLHELLSAEIILHCQKIDEILKKVPGWENDGFRKDMRTKIARLIVGKPDDQVLRRCK